MMTSFKPYFLMCLRSESLEIACMGSPVLLLFGLSAGYLALFFLGIGLMGALLPTIITVATAPDFNSVYSLADYSDAGSALLSTKKALMVLDALFLAILGLVVALVPPINMGLTAYAWVGGVLGAGLADLGAVLRTERQLRMFLFKVVLVD